MLLTFSVTALIMIMIPGPDAALIMRSSLAHGRTAGLLTMTGGLLGLGVHAVAAAIGLSALLAASPTAFSVLRWLGVAYLFWLGIQGLRARAVAAPIAEPASGTGLRHVRNGFLSNLLNPKVLLFFVTFLPQFMEGAAPMLLSAIFAALYALWFSFYNVVVDKVGALLRRPKVRARVERVTGALLVGFALRLAVQ
ncbi:LysE family translocator [Nonomuraea endophytica]|uniref:Threonine/homoserine/homoserine lactone efflux protein n=1 Tax=Nonomuraea endophytica TaxID=714136 RepID=A0A7W8EJ56_9ACTN|nr:LysE family translocator [Nonomuraea endophytica]MBB5082780.1 threonine/homoserine/homoserine lactone efflux protein [Nonomuraea endophytica]